MRLAFIFIAEPYQCYHGMAVAVELAAMSGVDVDIFYNEPAVLAHIRRIEKAHGSQPLPAYPLRRPTWVAWAQRMKIFGLMKKQIRQANAEMLLGYDAVISVENTLADIFDGFAEHPPLIYLTHGSGDRAVAFQPRIAKFDMVLPSGRKTADRMLALNLIRPGRYSTPGYIKLETTKRLRASSSPPFAEQRSIVLYNPHKDRKLGSWQKFVGPFLDAFSGQNEFNLIVAPHVKMFHRRSKTIREYWNSRSNDSVLVDTGSDRSLDNSYTDWADIYVGDVSSQVYEFLTEPRPCVFLNAHGVDWRDDPHYLFWHLGDVVDDPAQLMDAIRAAPSRHHLYRAAQAEAVASTLGDICPGAAGRAAQAIVTFVKEGSVEA